jgi:hypothetical protein
MSDRRDRRGYALATVCAIGVLWILKQIWSDWRDRRVMKQVNHELSTAGVKALDEEPVPVRLAESRKSLIASFIALTLIAVAMITYWMGLWGQR